MTTEDDFQKALSKKPRDWQTLLVFADWLQERNDPRAEGYRALGVHRVAPVRFTAARAWVWLNAHWAASYDDTEAMRAATLPDDWYKKIPHAKNMSDVAEERRALRDALNDAAGAFAKLPQARRTELLAYVFVPREPRKKKEKPKAKKKPARSNATRKKVARTKNANKGTKSKAPRKGAAKKRAPRS